MHDAVKVILSLKKDFPDRRENVLREKHNP